MDLWIRTQKKDQLIRADEIKIQNNTYDDESQILVANKHTYHYAGKYKTKNRALEILNEIQEKIQPSVFTTEYHTELQQGKDAATFDVVMQPVEDKITCISPNVVVYELPKE